MSEWLRLTTTKTGKEVDVRASAVLAFEPLDRGPGCYVYLTYAPKPAQVRETAEEIRTMLGIRA